MEKYYEILLTNPIFAGISREELASMLQCLSAKATFVRKGSPVFLEGDPAGFIGIVLEGSVRIVRDDYYGQRTLLAQAEPGDIFAEAYACAGADTKRTVSRWRFFALAPPWAHSHVRTSSSNTASPQWARPRALI